MNILNYQGNKTKLLDFIYENCARYIQNDKAVLDIFSGGGAVCSYFAKDHLTYANDLEPYSAQISRAYICKNQYLNFDDSFFKKFNDDFIKKQSQLIDINKTLLEEERVLLQNGENKIIHFYKNTVPTLWNHAFSPLLNQAITAESIKARKEKYCLFTLLYSSSYFSLKQAIEIDAIRYAIDQVEEKYNKAYLDTCLFHAMNVCVFSKDGHMAQPLNLEKNFSKGMKRKNASLIGAFKDQLSKYGEIPPVANSKNKVFNLDFIRLLQQEKKALQNVGFIYADPPYTDMQYSRYYHLLNTACVYEFSEPTVVHGRYSNGLYLSGRNKSEISEKRSFLNAMRVLFDFCSTNRINLAISFGYPDKKEDEKTDRYLTSIDKLVDAAIDYFGKANVSLKGQEYEHTNQRKSKRKKVIEYLILCRGDRNAR